MTLTAEDKAVAWARADTEIRAARTLLLDRATDPRAASIHILQAWRAAAEASGAEGLDDAASLSAWVASAPWVPDKLRATAADLVTKLGETEATWAPIGVRRRALLAHLRQLHKAGRPVEREAVGTDTLRRRAIWTWTKAVVAATVLAWFVYEIRGQTGPIGGGPWRGEYYPTQDFRGPPKLRRDVDINFEFGGKPPLEWMNRDKYSMKWDTCLVLDTPRSVRFQLVSDDGSRLSVDGALLVDNWRGRARNPAVADTELGAGVHHLHLEYFEYRGNARMVLRASFDGEPPIAVPRAWLRYPGDDLDPDDPCGDVAR